jgi:acyl-CoA synthetase (AMP-forming)/AMP-acid ligase II
MPQLLIGDALRATARKLPDRIAFVFKNQRCSYREFEQRVNRLANGLLAKGYQPGDHIAILAFNCIEYYEILFALAKVGMVGVPVNFRYTAEEIGYVVNHGDAKALIYEAPFRDVFRGVRAEFEKVRGYFVFGGDGDPGDIGYEDLLASSSPADPAINVSEAAIWYICYTSGTTGRPKGAMRSHRSNILMAANNFYRLDQETVALLIMPIFHYNSIIFGLIGVYQGATIVIYPSGGFKGREILEIIEKEKVTFSSMVPTMYTLIFQIPDKDTFDTSSLNRLLSSSAPLMTKTKEQILEFFKSAELYEGYGATETGGMTLLHPKDQYRKVRSCGQANVFCRIKLINAQGRECAPGEVGEIYTVSPGQFEGYYKDPEKTAQGFMGEYFSVGDMATVDEEGFYYIVDRKNDMIISGGENIYPTEVDDLLSKHPKIFQAAVIGVPDEKWGEAVKAVIVCKPGKKLTAAEVIAYCKQHLAGYKCPKTVDFWEALPVSHTGKILKREIRSRYWKGQEAKI